MRPLAPGDPLPGLSEALPPRSLALPGFVWGIDPSTLRVSVAVVRNGLEGWETLSLPTGELGPRLAGAHSWLAGWFLLLAERWPPVKVTLEEPFGAGRAKVHPNSERTFGVVLAALCGAVGRTEIDMVNPNTWKSVAMGKGHGFASKNHIIEWARAGGYTGVLSDEADAIGIATAGALRGVAPRVAA